MLAQTLPVWSLAWGLPLDAIRRTIRGDVSLRDLGVRIGPTRVYGPDDAETIRSAVVARQTRLAARAAKAVQTHA